MAAMSSAFPTPLEAPELPRLRGRATRSLFAGVALGSTGVFAAITAGPLIAEEITGVPTWSGLPGTSGILGTAVGATVLSRVMVRRGRRPGLSLGYGIGIAGGAAVVASAEYGVFLLLLAGMVMIGIANASNQLARFAAADLQPEHRRASGLGLVVWAGTVGALAGPNLLAPSGGIAARLGWPPLSGPYAAGAVVFAAAVVLYSVLLRPDPSSLGHPLEAGAAEEVLDGAPPWRHPAVQVGVATLVSAQVVMVLIMTMTPLHIRHGGHGLGIVGFVMSAHVVGMFAFAPLFGRMVDRFGAIPVVLTGLGTLAASGLSAALSPATGAPLAAPLLLLGLGWSLSFVAGSSLLTHGLAYAARARIQGAADTIVHASAAVAALASGVVLSLVGYPTLCLIGVALLSFPASVLLRRGRVAAAA